MDIRAAAQCFIASHQVSPYCLLACAGWADEHWQLFHPDYLDMPAYTLADGTYEQHPDSPLHHSPE